MKTRMALAIFMLFSVAAVAESSQDAFNKLKSLEGSWSGKTSEGQPVEVTYQVTSGGSAVMSEIKGHGEDMITMFHMDGDRLLMTHYCGAGNQPRMAATASNDGKSITFNYIDATNLLPSQPGHMEQHIVKFTDANHYTEVWEFAANNGSKKQEVFDLQRVK